MRTYLEHVGGYDILHLCRWVNLTLVWCDLLPPTTLLCFTSASQYGPMEPVTSPVQADMGLTVPQSNTGASLLNSQQRLDLPSSLTVNELSPLRRSTEEVSVTSTSHSNSLVSLPSGNSIVLAIFLGCFTVPYLSYRCE